jgi:transaldolase
MTTPMKELADYGQSLWLDYIDRPLLETDKLRGLVEQGLRGLTSNPSIFQNAIGATNDYDEDILRLKSQGKSLFEIYDTLTIADIQLACDRFLPVFESTRRLDGYVSLEINPQLAARSEMSVAEGVRLFHAVARPNVMIKVPATPEGFPVITELISQGINVNATLIFSRAQYENTVEAYFRGLRNLADRGGDLNLVRSVASVFVSRVDTAVDKLLEAKAGMESDDRCRARLLALRGKAAVANCRLIFEKFKALHDTARFKDLFENKAHEQRVLWASTGTKNPAYSDIKYLTELISRPTVNTVPEATLEAWLDHGAVRPAMDNDADAARAVIAGLGELGVDLDQVCAGLLDQGVEAFKKAFASLFVSLENKSRQLTAG